MGELFALGAAACWTGSSILFAMASQMMGGETVNRARLVLALLAVTLINWFRLGHPIPVMPGAAAGWLVVSGFIGFALGDAMLFEAYVHVGASVAMLLMTLAPIFSALIGWIYLREILSLWQILAVLITLAGIALVILHPSKNDASGSKKPQKISPFGLIMGLGAALGQAVGLFFSKRGMLLGAPPLEANQVRLLTGAVVILLWGLVRGQLGGDRRKLRGLRRWKLIAGGTIFGPIVGVLFSLLAVKYAHMALAATLMGLTPVLMLPVLRFGFGERFSLMAIIGTVTAVLGAGLLFWV